MLQSLRRHYGAVAPACRGRNRHDEARAPTVRCPRRARLAGGRSPGWRVLRALKAGRHRPCAPSWGPPPSTGPPGSRSMRPGTSSSPTRTTAASLVAARPRRPARRAARPTGAHRHVGRRQLHRVRGDRTPERCRRRQARRRVHRRGDRAARAGGALRVAGRGDGGRHRLGRLQRERPRRRGRASSTSQRAWRWTARATSSSPTRPTAGSACCPPPRPRPSSDRP